MKCSVKSAFKFVLVATLSILVVGIALFSIFGFNNNVDYEDSYEIVVGISQNIEEKVKAVNEKAEKYFDDKKVEYVSKQSFNDGAGYIYKFDSKTDIDVDDLKNEIESVVNGGASVIVKVSEVKAVGNKLPLAILWIALIPFAVILVYLFFIEKFASALSVVFTSILSALMFASFMGITRLPAYPNFPVMLVASGILSSCVSAVMVNRFKNVLNTSGFENKPKIDIVDLGAKQSLFRVCSLLALAILSSIALMIVGGFLMGLQTFVMSVSTLFVSYYWTSYFWAFLKK